MIIIKITTQQRKVFLKLKFKKMPSSSLTEGGETTCRNVFLMGISLKGYIFVLSRVHTGRRQDSKGHKANSLKAAPYSKANELLFQVA
jgi:hypothetical protein